MSSSYNIRPFGKNTAAANSVVIIDGQGRMAASRTLTWNESTAALTCLGTITVGASAAGKDVKIWGETAGCYLEYDASADQLNLAKTSAASTGTTRSAVITQTMTTGGAAAVCEVFVVDLVANVTTGSWANAIVGKISYGASGLAQGMAAAGCFEMQPPNALLSRGGYYSLDLEFNIGSSSSGWASTGPHAWINFGMYGTTTTMDDHGYLFNLNDVAVGSGKLFQVNTAGDATHGLRVWIDGGVYYLMLTNVAA